MTNSKLIANDQTINISEVADFPFRQAMFSEKLEEFTANILDSEGLTFGQIAVYSNKKQTQFVMILYVPDSRLSINASDVTTLALEMIKTAEKLKKAFDDDKMNWSKRKLNLLEFIMPKTIEVSLVFNLKGLLKLQFKNISGTTTTVFNPNVQFHGDPIALIAKLVKVGYFKGIEAGRKGFEHKISSARSDSITTGEQFGEEFL